MSLQSRLTTSPSPQWVPGDKQPSPHGADVKHVSIDPQKESSVYSLMISSCVPRPVAFVSTVSAMGKGNLAPFSYFGIVSHDPPTLMLGICTKSGGVKKDTIVNIEATGELVVNIISDWMVEAASHCAGNYPAGVSELEVAGLTALPSEVVAPCRVAESAVHFECKLLSTQDIFNDKGDHTTTMVLATVARVHVMEPLLKGAGQGRDGGNNYSVDYAQYRPVGRLGGDSWVHLGDAFDIKRPADSALIGVVPK